MNCLVLKGDTNIKYLTDNGVKIWNEWADEKWRFRSQFTVHNGEVGKGDKKSIKFLKF